MTIHGGNITIIETSRDRMRDEGISYRRTFHHSLSLHKTLVRHRNSGEPMIKQRGTIDYRFQGMKFWSAISNIMDVGVAVHFVRSILLRYRHFERKGSKTTSRKLLISRGDIIGCTHVERFEVVIGMWGKMQLKVTARPCTEKEMEVYLSRTPYARCGLETGRTKSGMYSYNRYFIERDGKRTWDKFTEHVCRKGNGCKKYGWILGRK